MIQRFLIATIVGFLFLTSKNASAADIDWDSAPHFANKAELAKYIEDGRRKGQKVFNFVLTSIEINNKQELDRLFADEFENGFAIAGSITYGGVIGTGQLNYTIITELPGTNVANAYLSSNQYQAWMNLTPEEQKLYNIAVGIVDEANKRSSEVKKVRYIHDEICKRVETFESGKNTAIYALVYKKSNCVGYTDAFYMLGRMCGLNVGRIGGIADSGGHAWNWITFADGKTYCVDVTLDDGTNSDNWFLKTRSHMEKTHSCDWDIIPNL